MEMSLAEIAGGRVELTGPDYRVYVPGDDRRERKESNEHFLVFEGPGDVLMAVWTQSWHESAVGPVNHTVFARSEDDGRSWSAPRIIAGPDAPGSRTPMTNWAFPMVSRSGRIYVVWNQNRGVAGWIGFHTGTMSGIFSDTGGNTWSEPQDIPMAKSPYDDPTGRVPPEWIVWQRPTRDLSGDYLVGYTRWVNKAVAYRKEVMDWTEIESVCEFMRFTNVDDDPEPRDLKIRYSAWGDKALRVPHRQDPHLSVAQEPSFVRLPDNSLFCVMRTASGYVWWSRSHDDGANWTNPRPLLYRDHDRPLMNPVASCPIYTLSDGRFVIFYHNNPGGKGAGGFNDATPRDPLYLSLGQYREKADQPVWFDPPKLAMATEGVGIDGVKRLLSESGSGCLSLYASFTSRHGSDVLWYPDTKYFLLGKRIGQ